MTDLFDSFRERDKAIQSAGQHAPDRFREAVLNAIKSIIMRSDLFTADDIWNELKKSPQAFIALEPRALGAILKTLARKAVIESTGSWVPSTRRHAAPIMVWRKIK